MPSSLLCLRDQYNFKEGSCPFLNGVYNGCVLLVTVYLLQYSFDSSKTSIKLIFIDIIHFGKKTHQITEKESPTRTFV